MPEYHQHACCPRCYGSSGIFAWCVLLEWLKINFMFYKREGALSGWTERDSTMSSLTRSPEK